jgi:ribosomal-protein-alanine N-acetyltransferase
MKSRIILRTPALADERGFLESARRSRTLHRPWLTAPRTAAEFRAYVKRMTRPENRAFLICRRDTGAIVGVVNISNIVLGLFRSGYLGYYAFAGNQREGLMREGLAAVVRFAFGSMKLHRLEANIQPGNRSSIALVKACGFAREGYSPRYLKIGGRWRDHERWAIVAR